eukprot:TRINITY_DN31978_c0_g1_i1.p1 TRINITY_DN31978_c0_g1~~TRINITY_DN31978_c0_g1_i1.p1  ORF type:complete len:539 (+),score=164.55 TRINITY_DN31978_c0_g1_i1:89-1705(+)
MRAAAIVAAAGAAAAATAPKPNIMYVLVDDYGWADAGWHRPQNYTDVQTPNFKSLVAEGVELDRHYVFKFCSPTRSAVQSGRNPIHVNVLNLAPTFSNPKDPVGGYAAVPRNMTGMAEVMARAGYETHMYGKWDAGMATPQHTPHGRGYQHSLFYFHHANDYWTSRAGGCPAPSGRGHVEMVDLYSGTAPAHGKNNSGSCSQSSQAGCTYEDQLFAGRVYDAIRGHQKGRPLFLFWAPHIVHTPLQVPERYLQRFSFIDDQARQFYHSMVYYVDEAVGNATKLMKESGMWDDTLVVLHADNGGPIYASGNAGANNYPLKGGKMSNWEGGIRVNAFASGGFIPAAVRGTKQEGYVCGWDWYATFAALAGEDPTDHRAAAAGLPPIDSVNVWPLVSGENGTSPRAEIPIGDFNGTNSDAQTPTLVGGLISGDFKILIGTETMAGWPGPHFPNTSSSWNPSESREKCGTTPATGCMYNIIEDPGEHHNLASSMGERFEQMLRRVEELQQDVYSPDRGVVDPKACELGTGRYGGFWGPFLHL